VCAPSGSDIGQVPGMDHDALIRTLRSLPTDAIRPLHKREGNGFDSELMIFDFCGLGCGIETFEFVRLVFLLESSPHPRFTASSLEKERPSAERRVGRAFAMYLLSS